MFILTPIYSILTFLFTLLTYILAPLLALTADTTGNLPHYLRYFQTFDATLDAGWKDGYWPKSKYIWWDRTKWLWRNPGYTFDYEVLGMEWYDWQWKCLLDTPTVWFAWCQYDLAFNLVIHYKFLRFKLGWKAWNHYNSGTKQFDGSSWSTFDKIPFVFSISLRSPNENDH